MYGIESFKIRFGYVYYYRLISYTFTWFISSRLCNLTTGFLCFLLLF